MSLKRVRRKIREGHYEFTAHALEEMDEDDLDEADVRQAILHGEISAELTDDPPAYDLSCAEQHAIKTARWKWFVVSCHPICCV